MFWKKSDDTGKKDINSSEYETCLKRILEGNTRIESLIAKVNALETDVANLRGKFNARLTKIKTEEQKEQEEQQTQQINTDGTIPFG